MSDFAVYEAFRPRDYLQSYYGELKSEAEGLLRFLVESFAALPGGVSVLEFGGGPTLIGMIPAARRAGKIHFCDYVKENRQVIDHWLVGDESDFDWSPFIARCLELEGVRSPGREEIAARAERIRDAVTRVTTCDIYQSPPVAAKDQFDVIVTNYCLDAVTNDKDEWYAHIRNVKSLLRPGGLFIMSSLEEGKYSDFGETRYPNVYLVEEDIPAALRACGFDEPSIRVARADADHGDREYRGVLFGSATTAI